MVSEVCARAIQDSLKNKKALLKYISPNEVGLTRTHQYGFYLPKEAWSLFSLRGPVRGENHKHAVSIMWHDGRQTNSTITWYGEGTRSEYRLTGFGRGFPHRSRDNVGNLLVLVPAGEHALNAYVLDDDDDMSEIQASLGTEITSSWAAYVEGAAPEETEDVCLRREFVHFVAALDSLPSGMVFSTTTRDAIRACVPGFVGQRIDDQLLRLTREEYTLFRMAERKVFMPAVSQQFKSIDSFIRVAQSILQSRKSRAGRSLENHVEYLLRANGVRFEMRPTLADTEPDIIIPGKAEYDNSSFPREKLFMVGLKTTCKERWRQVLNEAPGIPIKHILTLQEGISGKQLDEMTRSSVKLVVPSSLHDKYPQDHKSRILTVDGFVSHVKSTLADQ